jgi:DNA polymerase III delta subunit
VIYLVLGPDRFLARQSTLAIASELDPAGDNTTWLDGRETPLDEVITKIGSASLFGAPRVVIVSDLLSRSGREPRGGEAAGADDERLARGVVGLASLVAAVPDDYRLILFEPSLSTAPAAFRSAAPQAQVIPNDPPRGAALVEWILSRAKESGAAIDRRTATQLADTLFPQTWNRKPNNQRYDVPPDIALLAQEIEKLAVAAAPNAMSSEHIHALVVGGSDQRLFQFIDAALAGNVRTAAGELDRLMAAGEEPAMLLAQLLGQVELATIAAATGKDANTVARDLGSVTPGRMSAVMSLTSRQPSRLARAHAVAVAADRAVKTGRVRQPYDALHDLILDLAQTEDKQSRSSGWSR